MNLICLLLITKYLLSSHLSYTPLIIIMDDFPLTKWFISSSVIYPCCFAAYCVVSCCLVSTRLWSLQHEIITLSSKHLLALFWEFLIKQEGRFYVLFWREYHFRPRSLFSFLQISQPKVTFMPLKLPKFWILFPLKKHFVSSAASDSGKTLFMHKSHISIIIEVNPFPVP